MRKLIRKVNVSDASQLIELNKLSNKASHVVDDVEHVQKSLSNDTAKTVYVTEVDGELIGFVTAQITNSFCYVRPTVELTEIYMEEDF